MRKLICIGHSNVTILKNNRNYKLNGSIDRICLGIFEKPYIWHTTDGITFSCKISSFEEFRDVSLNGLLLVQKNGSAMGHI